MATITRRWYEYNGFSGGETNNWNYWLVTSFPNACTVTATNICAVLGVFSITDFDDPSYDEVFYIHPQSFSLDTALFYYITAAIGHTTYIPSGVGQKPYVYKRFF